MAQRKQLASFLFLATSALPGAAQLGACGDDGVKHLADAPPHVDAAPVDAPAGPRATYATAVAFHSTCGDLDAPTQTFVVSNPGTEALVISNYSLTGDTDFHVAFATDLPLTVGPGANTTLTLTAPRAVVGTDLPATTKTTSLVLMTNLSTAPPAVALTMTVQGAALGFSDNGGTALPAIALTSASSSCPAPLATFLKNTGDQSVTITGAAGGGILNINNSASGMLGPGSSIALSFSTATNGSCAGSGTISVFVSTPNLCNGDSSSTTFYVPATFTIDGTSCFCS